MRAVDSKMYHVFISAGSIQFKASNLLIDLITYVFGQGTKAVQDSKTNIEACIQSFDSTTTVSLFVNQMHVETQIHDLMKHVFVSNKVDQLTGVDIVTLFIRHVNTTIDKSVSHRMQEIADSKPSSGEKLKLDDVIHKVQSYLETDAKVSNTQAKDGDSNSKDNSNKDKKSAKGNINANQAAVVDDRARDFSRRCGHWSGGADAFTAALAAEADPGGRRLGWPSRWLAGRPGQGRLGWVWGTDAWRARGAACDGGRGY